jgi:hypothetical protein
MEGRITIAINIYNELCAIHKPGGVHVDPNLISRYHFIITYFY